MKSWTARALCAALVAAAAAPAPSYAAALHEDDPKLLHRRPPYAGQGWRNAQRMPHGGGGPLLAGGPAIDFPSERVTLLAWLTLDDFGIGSESANDCWGYESPSGREYALVGLYNGLAFVEITQPGNPQLVWVHDFEDSLWRDVKVYGEHAYAVSEGGGGVMVYDLAQIDQGSVSFLGSVLSGGTSATHNVVIDTATGMLYRTGGDNLGLRIYSLANPASPLLVGQWNDRYVHDAQVVTYTSGPYAGRSIAYCCSGFDGGWTQTGVDVLDVTDPTQILQLDRAFYPGPAYSHQAWLSEDRQYLYLNDELDENGFLPTTTHVFDVSDPTDLVHAGSFTNGSTAVGHNVYVRGDLLYEANYLSGLRVFDLGQSATNPPEVAWFDTDPDDDAATTNGLWSCYPWLSGEVVIGSHIERGFFVWWVGDPQLDFVLPGGAPMALAPGGVDVPLQIVEHTPGDLVAAQLVYDIGAGPVAVDVVDQGGGAYALPFPALPCGTSVTWYVTGQAANGLVWTSPAGAPADAYTSVVATGAQTVLDDDAEADLGWTVGAPGDTASTGIWTRGNPNGSDAQPEDDHTPGGTDCWFTGQASPGAGVGSNDVDGGATTLVSPTFDLTGATGARVSYWRWFSNDQGSSPGQDVLRVDVSDDGGQSWVALEVVGPTGAEAQGGWRAHSADLLALVQPTDQVVLRFVASDEDPGSIVEAAIDDLLVETFDCGGPQVFCSGDGSATACPCGNTGAANAGCASSAGPGATLSAQGTASVAADDVLLVGEGMPATAPALYIQGSQQEAGGAGSTFGDGLRCVAGAVVRLGTEVNAFGGSAYPGAGDASVSVRGGVQPGDVRHYQVWYRNVAGPCGGGFNLSNALTLDWAP